MTHTNVFKAMESVIDAGFALTFGEFTLMQSGDCFDYSGEKEFVVTHPYKKPKGYNSVRAAKKYMENY